MVKIPNIVPITDLRQDATAIVKRVRKSREPIIITQRGRAAWRTTSILGMNLNYYVSLPVGKKKSRRVTAMTLTQFSQMPMAY
ncbi:MAG: type II toxin-antitoxin system Phd/YefM family antitoxin [Thermodesulfovibrionales bacterium]